MEKGGSSQGQWGQRETKGKEKETVEVSGEAGRGRAQVGTKEQAATSVTPNPVTSSASWLSTHHDTTIPGKQACTVSPASTPESNRREL